MLVSRCYRAPLLVACALLLNSTVFAGTQKTFFQNGDLNDANNYNPAGLPSSSDDVLLTTAVTALTLNAATLQLDSLNVTSSASYVISNNTSTSTDSTLSLLPFSAGGNSIAPSGLDAIYLGAANSSLTIQGPNAGTGTGPLMLSLNFGGNVDVAQPTGVLNISARTDVGSAASMTKTGAGVLNLSGVYFAFGGGLNINGGTTNFLAGFSNLSPTRTLLSVNNPNTGPATNVTLNVQTSVQFRAVTGTIAAPSTGMNAATINLLGTGTELAINPTAGPSLASLLELSREMGVSE